MSKILSYRPDIDTLRALAVVSVIIFHLNPQWLSGGFLGVDIFFVISGFLITMIIHREMTSGTFSFKAFYIRRIKRILPAFFVVLAASVAIGAWLFTPNDFFFLLKSALVSMGFVANLYYARGQGYFDPAQGEKPLLHIWSLSIEEQYYFIFPILLLLVIKRGWKMQFALLFVLITASIAASFIPTYFDKYYLTHLRAFEMLFGSLTAVLMQYQQQKYGKLWGEKYARLGSLLSITILLFCLFCYTSQMPYFPGLAAVIPCAAASGYIYFNAFNHNQKVWFEWKGTVFIGLISYSLYLWHWPILVFTRYITGENELPTQWIPLLALVIFILATLSYFIVEKPFKRWKGNFIKSITLIYAAPTVVIAAAAFMVTKAPLMKQYSEKGLAHTFISCHNSTDKQCTWGDTSKSSDILVLGDSHADQYKTFLDVVGKKEGWLATMISSDSCAYVEGYDADIYHKSAPCRTVYQYAKQHLPEYKKVMLIMRWGNQVPNPNARLSVAYDKDFFEKFKKTLNKLSAEKEAVYVFLDNQGIQYPALRAYRLSQILPSFSKNIQPKSDMTEEGNQRIRELVKAYPNVYLVDVTKYIPQDFTFDGLPIYADFDHINPYGGRKLAEKFMQHETLLPK